MSLVQLLELDVTADPSVLLRIVSLCHKRGLAIASLEYESNSMRLGLRCDAERARQAARWLDAIIPVLAVSQSPPPLGTGAA